MLYGHLDPKSMVNPGTKLKPGQVVGYIGERGVNGGWTPHLHVQCFDEYVSRQHENLLSIDGYGPIAQKEDLATHYANPHPLICY